MRASTFFLAASLAMLLVSFAATANAAQIQAAVALVKLGN